MKITNNHNLPQPVYDAIVNDGYTKGGADISVTELIDSPRVRVLKKQHDPEIVVDASTMIQSLLGKGMHLALEKSAKGVIAERRLSIEVSGWTISGGMDLYDEVIALDSATLTDYKSTNVWKMVYAEGGIIESFECQLNVYAEILRQNGERVTDLKICSLFKDWKEFEFKQHKAKGKVFIPWKQAGYPEEHFAYFSIPLWDEKKAKGYILTRVQMHQAAEKASESELYKCKSKGDTWSGRRCQKYCDVNRWCEQYQSAKKTGIM